jgi:hypothetical protein
MNTTDIGSLRLAAQAIAAPAATPEEAVSRLTAVQAQEYGSGLWAIGLRTHGCTQTDVERAIAEGKIVRSWPMRSTLHFVAARDLRWMLDLLGPTAIARGAGRARQLELTAETFTRSRKTLRTALSGGSRLTRPAAFAALEEAGIPTRDQRGIHILSRLCQEAVLCLGPREGKQQTFVLADDWVPQTKLPTRDEALARLAWRYFTGHGPATVRDFTWWSGLSAAEARSGLEGAKPKLVHETADGTDYWFAAPAGTAAAPAIHLLPAFDEYLVGYTDRRAVLDPESVRLINAGGGMLSPAIVKNGRIIAAWKRTVARHHVTVIPQPFAPLGSADVKALDPALHRYGAFLGLTAGTGTAERHH